MFAPITSEEMRFIIKQLPNKSSSLDPIPTWLLKERVEELLPIITTFVNRLMQEGTVPKSLKHALVTSILKKDGMDLNILSNFRPVTNLAFLAKILEKAVNNRLDGYLTANKLYDPLQSAYRKQCSTETALVKVSITPSDVASDRETLVSIDYAQSSQILLNMDTCVIVLPHPLYGTRYQRTFGQLRHLLR